MNEKFRKIVSCIREQYNCPDEFIPLHAPVFNGNEKKYLIDCIDSTFVSSVGKFVDRFEEMVADYTGAEYAIATVNGTAALHIALLLVGVEPEDEVLTQALTFVATPNAVSYCGATPVFLDSDRMTLGLSPEALRTFLSENAEKRADEYTYNRKSGKRIKACVPMHVFGHPVRVLELKSICDSYNITLVEDAAESLGSFYGEQHTGTFGKLGVLSFNGNKTLTTGGGGMILTNDEKLARQAKHLTTTAKQPHAWEYVHDQVGYNYRLPNLNAALGCAQMEQLDTFLEYKRHLAGNYWQCFDVLGVKFISVPDGCISNYWLNAIVLEDRNERDKFLEYSNANGVMTRPLWMLASSLKMYHECETDGLDNARWFEERVVNIPSGVMV